MASYFISYTKSDEDWARWVDRVLRVNGHHTIAMFADMRPGKNFAIEEHRGLASGAIVVPLLSPSALASDGVLSEFTNRLARDMGVRERGVIPVRIAECSPDGLLAGLVYSDMVGIADEAHAAAQLLRDLDTRFDPRSDDAPFPGASSANGAILRADVPFPPADPANADWPVEVNAESDLYRHVVGREDEVAELRRKLTEERTMAIVPGATGRGGTVAAAVVQGTGGIGKSTLARYYREVYGNRYFGIWWIDVETPMGLRDGLAELAVTLDPNLADAKPEAQTRAALGLVQKADDPWLLIYDNVPDEHAIAKWRPARGDVHVLVTSRHRQWSPKVFATHTTDKLAVPAAADLLEQESGRTYERAGAERLAEALDGLPLALVCAGAWLRDVRSDSFDAYIQRIEALLDDRPGTVEDYPNSVYAAVSLSIERLEADGKHDALLLLKLFAWLAPEGLTPDLLTALAAKKDDPNPEWREKLAPVPEALWRLAGDAAALDRAFADLDRRSLLERDETGGRIHRLTQAVQRARLGGAQGAEGGADWPAIAAAVIAAGYPYDPKFAENFVTCARLNPHVAALLAAPGGAPGTRAMDHLVNQAGVYYSAMRQDRLALSYALANLRINQRRGVVADDVLMGTGWNNLAVRLANQGRVVWAERASARAVEIAGANPATPDTNRAVRLSAHGNRLQGLAQHRAADPARAAQAPPLFARARVRMHQALRLFRTSPGRQSRQAAIGLNNIGLLHDVQGRAGAASVLYRTALSIRRKVLPPGDTSLGTGCHNLGALLLEQGQGDAARPLLAEALEIRRAAFQAVNPRHPHTLGTARWLGAALLLDGDRAAAQDVAQAHGLDMAEVEQTAEAVRQKWP